MSDPPVALVTGASRGIGRAVALRLARDGHCVAVNFLKRADAANAVVEQIEKLGRRAIALQGNVGEADDRARLIDETIERLGRIDVLVNNAG
ncbi:MAG: SDR family NAD(P)-dependent oxidoreductase, partial [Planctomycetes bacterium]|nr:SDR family NAD(P)-dependent oxidoreductase [Planctomycetota bacterium]